jgi:hypothetical protein
MMHMKLTVKKQFYFLFSLLALLTVNCAAPIKQFFPDTYYSEDRIYENKPLHFIVQFKGNWDLITDPNELSSGAKKTVVRWAKSGIELLFVGSTSEGLHTTRGMAENLNMPAREFAGTVLKNSESGVQNDRGLSDVTLGQNEMVKWVYDKEGFRYAEYFFAIDTYDIRIAFCSRPDAFERFLPVYEGIMATLEVTGGL